MSRAAISPSSYAFGHDIATPQSYFYAPIRRCDDYAAIYATLPPRCLQPHFITLMLITLPRHILRLFAVTPFAATLLLIDADTIRDDKMLCLRYATLSYDITLLR